jgi:uncharacterized protein
MNDLKFDWDKSKAALNRKKHGVSFEEAVTIFYDDDALEFHDPDHSESEDRFIMVGLSFKTKILVVSHCLRQSGTLIRIISARKATKQESQRYWEEKP